MKDQRDSTLVLLLLATMPSGLAAAEAPSFVEAAKLTGADTEEGDEFGHSVAISGDTVIVGAFFDDDRGPASGAAYVFERSGDDPTNWAQTAKLTAPDGIAGDWFGADVAIDGDTALVTASVNDGTRLGYAYIFQRDAGGAWSPVAKLLASDGVSNDSFAASGTALNGDTAVVGASLADLPWRSSGGAVYVFERNAGGPNEWGEVAKLTPAAQCEDDTAFCGWKGDSRFGGSVSISGDTLLEGGSNFLHGHTYIFERDPKRPGEWQRVARPIAAEFANGEGGFGFGTPVALDSGVALVGASEDQDLGAQAGAAYVFEETDPGGWRETVKLKARDGHEQDDFGASVGLDGATAVIGAPQVGRNDWIGQAYVFRRDGGAAAPWRQIAKLVPAGLDPFDVFSRGAVAISGETIVVGAYGDDDRGDSAGAVYIFEETRVDPAVTISGSCPGRVTMSATGLTPKGEVELYRSPADGAFAIPGGPCVGIALGLAEAELVMPALRLDESGGFELSPVLPEAACGSRLQLVDLTSCAVSNVETIP